MTTENPANDSEGILTVAMSLHCPACGEPVCKPDGTAFFSCEAGHSFDLQSFFEEQRKRADMLFQAGCKLLEEQADLFRKLAYNYNRCRANKIDLEDLAIITRFHRLAEQCTDAVLVIDAVTEGLRS